MFKDKYSKKAHQITQNYIETYGAHFENIDDLDDAIAFALRKVAEENIKYVNLPFCFTASTYGLFVSPKSGETNGQP